MKDGETRQGHIEVFINREYAENPGFFTIDVDAGGIVFPEEMEDEQDFLTVGDFERITLEVDPLPEPKGYVLPESTPPSAAILLKASYDTEQEWAAGDEIPMEIQLINSGQQMITNLKITGSLHTLNEEDAVWEETIYGPETEISLPPGDSISFTYSYTAIDAMPGEGDLSYLYFEGEGSTWEGMYVNAGAALPDPLHPAAVGCGSAALLLNASYQPISELKAGEQVIVNLEVYNVGESELDGLDLYSLGRNDEGIWEQTIPVVEDDYLPVAGKYVGGFAHTLTEDDLLCSEISFDIWAWAEVSGSFVLDIGLPRTVTASARVHVPLKDPEPEYYMYLTADYEEPEKPLELNDIIPVKLKAWSEWRIDENFSLIAHDDPMVQKETHDFYENLPVGNLGPGEPIEFTYYIKVQPEDLEAGFVSRDFQVQGDKILENGKTVTVLSALSMW